MVPEEPTLAPSSLNCTPATPTLSEEVAARVTEEPETVPPFKGAVSETDGALVSEAVATEKITVASPEIFPAVSLHLT